MRVSAMTRLIHEKYSFCVSIIIKKSVFSYTCSKGGPDSVYGTTSICGLYVISHEMIPINWKGTDFKHWGVNYSVNISDIWHYVMDFLFLLGLYILLNAGVHHLCSILTTTGEYLVRLEDVKQNLGKFKNHSKPLGEVEWMKAFHYMHK